MRQTQRKWPKSYPAQGGGRTGRSTRRGPRALAAAVLAGAAVFTLPATAGPAAAAAAPHGPRLAVPVGSWTATVVREGARYDVTLSFGADRSVCLVSPAGASKGRWHRTGPAAFDYGIREYWRDANGTVEGWVDIAQSAKQTGASFAGSGVSTVHAADGTVEATVPVSITAVRTGPPNGAPCA
ncbi:hypothetical protein [Streptomyces sp. NPDC005805]|uniref:hypothetical protein n=1 Tax=Streptomyces sp. NPDC005805 TaxID=3157068 RepID=UPI0033F5D119